MNRSIAWVLVPLLMAGSLVGCKPKDLEYVEVRNFRIEKFGLASSTLAMNVACYNPNSIRFKISGLSTDVYANNQYMGKAIMDSTIQVHGKDSFLVPVKMEVKMGGAVSSLLALVGNKGDSIPILLRMQGQAKIKKWPFGYDYAINYLDSLMVKF